MMMIFFRKTDYIFFSLQPIMSTSKKKKYNAWTAQELEQVMGAHCTYCITILQISCDQSMSEGTPAAKRSKASVTLPLA